MPYVAGLWLGESASFEPPGLPLGQRHPSDPGVAFGVCLSFAASGESSTATDAATALLHGGSGTKCR
jgi:hypothetical protein